MGLLVIGRVVTLALVGLTSQAQTTDAFEVTAIHPNQSGGVNTQISLPKGGRLIVVNASVKTLIRNAYGLLAFQFAGGPSWLDGDRFDINAQTGGAEEITPERLKPLLQNLLADRFRLRVHWETREEPVYALVADKNGPKFQTHSDASGQGTGQGSGHGMNTRKRAGDAQMRGTDVPMSELASNLGNQLGRFVTDQTGLAGHYDFVLDWDPDQVVDSTKPSLFTALKEQLGLKLESRKGPVQVLVIDSVERPSEN